jgi:hypothetical protein
MKSIVSLSVLAAVAGLASGTLGCAKSRQPQGAAEQPPPGSAASAEPSADHDHGGWWCAEHGVPEEVCGRCNTKLAAEFQRAGDWCQQHDRPDSQCFICHPQLQATFAARYEAKYGTPPPEPES